MKKGKSSAEESDIRTDYSRADFGKLTRGKFHRQVTEASNVVILDSAVAKEFPNSVAVNKALRAIISKRKAVKVQKRAVMRGKKSTRASQTAKRH
jgi:hypothetical protein